MKRLPAAGCFAATLGLLALSCAPKGAVKKQEVVFWVSWPVESVEPLARRFELEDARIQVRLVPLPWDSGQDTVAAAVRAGTPPDLCQLHGSQLAPFMAGNSLSDWSAGVADLRAGLLGWEMCMVGDAIYGLPWLLRSQVLYYNRTLLARAGLDSTRGPETWDELRAAAAAVHRPAHGVHGYGLPAAGTAASLEAVLPFAWSNGGRVLSAGLDSSRFDSPANTEALAFVLSLREVGLVAAPDSLERAFAEGRLGLMLAGSDLGARLARAAPRLRYGVALVPRPAPDRGEHASLAGGEVLVSFTGSRRKEDALRLARFLVRPENAQALATALRSVQPANVGADSATWYLARPDQQAMCRQLETARFLPNLRDWPAIEEALRSELDGAIDGRRTASEALALADTFITTHLGPR